MTQLNNNSLYTSRQELNNLNREKKHNSPYTEYIYKIYGICTTYKLPGLGTNTQNDFKYKYKYTNFQNFISNTNTNTLIFKTSNTNTNTNTQHQIQIQKYIFIVYSLFNNYFFFAVFRFHII